ncbi:MAG: cadherin-like domain-containing protein, partial [Synechococcaceae cyanobacterium]
GNDTIYGAGLIDGGDDNDNLYYLAYSWTGQPAPTVLGGAGNDFIAEWDNRLNGTLLDGGAGNDTINGSSYNDNIVGGDGDDVLRGNGGADTIDGGDGNDRADYGGTIDQYTVLRDGNDFLVYYNRSGSPDGVDRVRNVELLAFAGGVTFAPSAANTGTLQSGDADNNQLTGSEFGDQINGGDGDDTIQGLGGNDQLNGQGGNDSIEGGDGGDVINAGTGADTVLAGSGNDSVLGGTENDSLLGDAGNDTIYGNAGNDSGDGGDGADYLQDSEGINTATGGAGNDTIYGAGLIDGGDDNDNLYYLAYSWTGQPAPTVLGGAGNDFIAELDNRLNGTLLDGGAGNDTINGSSYNDNIVGGDGDDVLRGNGGADTIDGGDGANIAIYGGSRSQYSVVGDAVGLTIYDHRSGSPDGVDVVRNVSVLRFSDQDVSVESQLSGVLLEGTPGDDPAQIGTKHNDTLRGQAGDDVLSGLAGNDLLEGGDGNDTLQGGSGDDTIDGGAGLNRAIFSGNRADYSISPNGGTLSGTTTVVDLQPSIHGNDGTDVLTGVRLLQFLDQLYAINTPPLAVTDNASTTEETAVSISLASLLANDSDADGDPLSITGISAILNGNASISGSTLNFTPNANFNGIGVVTYTLSDGYTTTPGTLSITVTSVNDAPSGADKTITLLEDTAYTFSATDFGFIDPADSASSSGANSLQGVFLSSLPTTGSLTLAGATVTLGQDISAANLSSLTFPSAAHANGSGIGSFTFQVRDNGGTANGGVDLDPTANTIRFNATPVNDAPSGTNATITVAENTPYTFSAADFGFSDPADAASAAGANSLHSARITTLPGSGSLRLAGSV